MKSYCLETISFGNKQPACGPLGVAELGIMQVMELGNGCHVSQVAQASRLEGNAIMATASGSGRLGFYPPQGSESLWQSLFLSSCLVRPVVPCTACSPSWCQTVYEGLGCTRVGCMPGDFSREGLVTLLSRLSWTVKPSIARVHALY